MTQETSEHRLEKLSWWKQSWIVPLFLFLGAFIVRLLYLVELSGTIYWDFLLVDAKSYHEIAVGEAAAGTWLAPLYGWILRLIYIATGSDLWAPRLLQALVGAGTVVLVYLAALRIGGKIVGIIAGIISAIYLPHIFYGAHLMKATWATFFLFAGFFLLLEWCVLLKKGNRKKSAITLLCLAGISLGIGTLFRGNILILILFIFIWVLVVLLKKTKSASVLAPLFLAAFIIWPACIIALNSTKERELVGLTTSAGFNFFEGNSWYSTGYHADIPHFLRTAENESQSARAFAAKELGNERLTWTEINSFYRNEATKWISRNPGAWLGLIFKKLYYFFNRLEIPDNYNYSFMAERSFLLRIPFTGQWLIAPLALAGIFLFWPRKIKLPQFTAGKNPHQAAPLYESSLLYIFTLGYMLAVIIFYVTGRMRLPAAPFLIIFASLFIIEIAERLRSRIKTAIPWLIILAAACVFVWWPAPPSTLGYVREHFTLATHAAQAAKKAQAKGNMSEAIGLFDKAVFEYEKAIVYSKPDGKRILHRNALSISRTVANAYRRQAGHSPEAVKWYSREKRHAEALKKIRNGNGK